MRFLLAAVVAVLLVGLVPAVTPKATAQPGATSTEIEVTEVTPSIIGPDSPPELTITGTVANTGNRTLSNLEMRVQRGTPRTTESDVRAALQGNTATAAHTRFTTIAGSLSPGSRERFTLHIPITGGTDSLRISHPGVYPLLLNVNGAPTSGNRARVAEAQFMLPVLAPPGSTGDAPDQPTPFTMLIPLIDRPRMERAGTPGSPAVLTDDRLAQSLAPGGRLFGLVDAVGKKAPPGSPVGRGLCFAVDPDLIVTARAMADGYRVRHNDGSTRQGRGTEAAKRWLTKLREVVQGRCVIALPYGDADIVALGRAGLPDLVSGALDGAEIVRAELGVAPRRDILWPIDGALDEPAATQLSGTGIDTLLMHPRSLALPRGSLQPVRIKTQNGNYTPTAHPVDPLLSRALNPHGGSSTVLSPTGDATLSALNTLGALAFRATAGSGGHNATSLLAPPRRWNLHGQDLAGLLTGLEKLTKAGYVQPTGFPGTTESGGGSSGDTESGGGSSEQSGSSHDAPPSRTTAAPTTPASRQPQQDSRQEQAATAKQLPMATLTYPVSAATEEIRQETLDIIAARNYKIGELYRAAERDPALNVDPADLTTSLRNGLLRSASSAWRGDPTASRRWVSTATEALADSLNGVRIDEFNGQISLTSSNSPIPVTVTNRLPVTVAVNLHVDSPPGITVTDLGLLKIPARGSRQFWLDTEVNRSGKFSVDITIRTEGGTQLGSTRRIQLESNAYGTMPLLITIVGAALLVLLSARRLVRRARAQRAEAAAGEQQPHNNDDQQETEQPIRGGSASSESEPAAPGAATESSDHKHPDTEHDATERNQNEE
ncbi:hypothetical protein DFQ14_101561 [Halopolyspora algeriensis]|uniref:Secreted protein n=1 Tax=Halopolyspora algeriensis TaxID=1500506 RepID=A0A368VZ84_9ACTN|nr:DUF6049 family protein [Halopolyspora algeriensis]RCW47215.1 hypothetical protein DFQ14_101561 [Halopolyspora algeriensis]TQM48300.1 hypothetical protein FHU43_3267 [Halopolyspora algeriensis]